MHSALCFALANGADSEDAAVVRVALGTRENKVFSRNLPDSYFYACFEALAALADGVGPVEHHEYAIFSDPVPATVRLVYAGKRELWTSVDSVFRPMYLSAVGTGALKFSVCITAECTKNIPIPDEVKEARAIARRIQKPLENPRTRLSMPKLMLKQQRRCLWFRQYSAWKIWFTVSDTTIIGVTNGIVSAERVLQTGGQLFDISLECVGKHTSATAAECISLISRISHCLGATEKELREKLTADSVQYEIDSCV